MKAILLIATIMMFASCSSLKSLSVKQQPLQKTGKFIFQPKSELEVKSVTELAGSKPGQNESFPIIWVLIAGPLSILGFKIMRAKGFI
jgi:hypothetical protein